MSQLMLTVPTHGCLAGPLFIHWLCGPVPPGPCNVAACGAPGVSVSPVQGCALGWKEPGDSQYFGSAEVRVVLLSAGHCMVLPVMYPLCQTSCMAHAYICAELCCPSSQHHPAELLVAVMA